MSERKSKTRIPSKYPPVIPTSSNEDHESDWVDFDEVFDVSSSSTNSSSYMYETEPESGDFDVDSNVNILGRTDSDESLIDFIFDEIHTTTSSSARSSGSSDYRGSSADLGLGGAGDNEGEHWKGTDIEPGAAILKSPIWDHLPKDARSQREAVGKINKRAKSLSLSVWSKFFLIFFQKLKLALRRRFVSTIEFFSPLFVLAFLHLYLYFNIHYADGKEGREIPLPFTEFALKRVHMANCSKIFIVPRVTFTESLANRLILAEANPKIYYDYVVVDEKEFLETHIRDPAICAAAVFDPPFPPEPLNEAQSRVHPRIIKYDLRLRATKNIKTDERNNLAQWQTSWPFSLRTSLGSRNRFNNTGGDPDYVSEGFAWLQHRIDRNIVAEVYDRQNFEHVGEWISPDALVFTNEFKLRLQRFPLLPSTSYEMNEVVESALSTVLMVAFLPSVLVNMWLILREKELKAKGFLIVFGVSKYIQTLAWICRVFVFNFFVLSYVTFGLTVNLELNPKRDGKAVINKTAPTLVFFFLMLFILNSISLVSFVAAFFRTPKHGVRAIFFLWIFTEAPYYYVERDYSNFPKLTRIFACLIPSSGLQFGCHLIALSEANSHGIQWENMFDADDGFSFGVVALLQLAGTVLWFIAGRYVENVFPTASPTEPQMPWFFFIMPWFWRDALPPDNQKLISQDRPSVEEQFPENFEEDQLGAHKEVVLRHISKMEQYDVILSNVNLSCYYNEIFAILGPAKSGKTTLASIIAGLMAPTFGNVYVNKHDLKTDVKYAKTNIGFGPQGNSLYEYLTVEENIAFFVTLKGASSDAFMDIEKHIEYFELSSVRRTIVRNITKTQQRLAHIIIAFGANSKTVILDEPTKDIPIAVKRLVWRFLEAEKVNRTIIVATSSPEEANLIGDRMAILAYGELQCFGTPTFIRSRYGGGYHLHIQKLHPGATILPLRSIVYQRIPDAIIKSETRETVHVFLPAECTPYFSRLFKILEIDSETYNVKTMSLSYTRMDELFNKVIERPNAVLTTKEFHVEHTVYEVEVEEENLPFQPRNKLMDEEVHQTNYRAQFWQLLLKEIRFAVRRYKVFLIPILLCALAFLLICLTFAETPFDKESESLELNLTKVPKAESLVSCIRYLSEPRRVCTIIYDILKKSSNAKYTPTVNNLELEINKTYTRNAIQFKSNTILAIELKIEASQGIDLLVRFNNDALHAIPIGINVVANIMMRNGLDVYEAFTYKKIHKAEQLYEIVTYNNPLPYNLENKLALSKDLDSPGFYLSLAIVGILTVIVPLFIVFPLRERIFRTIQVISGVNMAALLLSKFIWDFILYLLTITILIFILAICNVSGFDEAQTLTLIFVLLIFTGYCAMGIINFITQCVADIPVVGYFRACLVLFFIGLAPMSLMKKFVSISKNNPQSHGTRLTKKASGNIFMAFPFYVAGDGIFKAFTNAIHKLECSKHQMTVEEVCHKDASTGCCHYTKALYSFTGDFGIGKHLLILALVGTLAHLAAIWMETPSNRRFRIWWKEKNKPPRRHKRRKGPVPDFLYINDEESAMSGSDMEETEETKLYIKDLSLVNKTGRTVVKKLTLGINRHTCFGIVGLEGSGKTEILDMLVGHTLPTTGDASIAGESMNNDFKMYRRNIGFCPKAVSLVPELTGREMLVLIGTIRKVPYDLLEKTINVLSANLHYFHELEVRAKEYSHTTLKKLAFSLAIIGNPDVLLLEEPTTGVDPESRKHITETLGRLKENSTVLVSSRQMDICEKVCDKIAILVNGKVQCIGSPRSIKKSNCQGYTITVMLIPENPNFYDQARESSTTEPSSSSLDETEFEDDLKDSQSNMSLLSPTPSNQIRDVKKKRSIKSTRSQRSFNKSVSATSLDWDSENVYASSSSSTFSGDSLVDSDISDFKLLEIWERELVPLFNYFEYEIPESELKDWSLCFLHYHLKEEVKLSTLFRKMEICRICYDLENYTIGRSSLVQVFLNYAQAQIIPDERDVKIIDLFS